MNAAEIDVDSGIDVGVRMAVYGGWIPEYEEREAALFQGIAWPTWTRLSTYERTRMVAHYQLHNKIELHTSKEVRRRSASSSEGD